MEIFYTKKGMYARSASHRWGCGLDAVWIVSARPSRFVASLKLTVGGVFCEEFCEVFYRVAPGVLSGHVNDRKF